MIDAIRHRKRAKRKAPTVLFECEDEVPGVDVEALNDALVRLEGISPDLARIVDLRFFVGLGIDEIAVLSETSAATVKRRWKTARLWLANEMQRA